MERTVNGASQAAEDAAKLDRLLGAAVMPSIPVALERRILADFDRVQGRWTMAKLLRRAADAVWPGAPVWQPACTFALSLMIGVGAAMFAPFDIPQQDDGSSSVYALDNSPDLDAGQGI